jgi:hypothetical protein
MRCDPPGPDDDDGDPSSAGVGDDPPGAAGPEGPVVDVSTVADGVVVVAVRAAATRESAVALRHTALAQLARHPRMVIVEFTPAALEVGNDGVLPAGTVAVLTEIAREAGAVDIGLCLVIPADHIGPVLDSLDEAGVRELFELRPTITAALDPPP